MTEQSLKRDSSLESLVGQVADEFLRRQRQGEQPNVEEYLQRYPEAAHLLRSVLASLRLLDLSQSGAIGSATSSLSAESDIGVLGDFRILREVGKGGMGVVYEAEQVSLGRHVALKVLPAAGLMNPTFLERFRREAKAAARLHHTNIVPVFGVGEADGVHFYAMQFIQGQSLDQVLSDVRRLRKHIGAEANVDDVPQTTTDGSVANGLLTGQFETAPAGGPEKAEPDTLSAKPTPTEPCSASGLSAGGSEAQYFRSVARVGLQTADALAYAHRQGILHRDIKLSNLLLDQQGTVWITDFGLAKAEGTDELTHTGDIVGTVRYMAPERFDGQSLPQSDVYSLGLTLYEMLTLRPAFDDANRARLIEKILHEPPVPPRRLDPQIPRDLETIVLKCLAKDAASRYATAEELAEDLRLFLAYRTIRARRASRWEQTWRWCRRNPVVASLLTAVAVLLVAVAVVSAFYAALQKAAAIELAGALKDTEKAERAARLREAEALVGQAHGTRNSRRPGQRIDALAALEKALAIGRELDQPAEWFDRLRDEAIAAFALPDVEVLREWEGWPAGTVGPEFDDNLERYALLETDGTISVRRVSDDTEIARWKEPAWPRGDSLRFSPGGRLLCIHHSPSGRLRVRRLDGPKPILCHEETKARNGAAMDFSSDGKRLAYLLRTDTRVAVVDLTSEQVRYLPPTGAENREHIRFAPDGSRLALLIRRAGKWTVEVYDATTGQVQRSFPQPTTVSHFAWNPDGRTLATCCNDHVIRLWDLVSDRLLWSQPHPTTVSHLVWHPDGRTLATCCDDLHIRLWDQTSGRLLRELEGNNDAGIQCAFTHTGDWMVSNDWDNTLRIWEVSSGRQLLRYSAGGGLRVSSDDRVVAAHLIDPTSTQLLRLHAGQEYRTISAAVSRRRNIHYEFPKIHPSGRLLAVTGTEGSVVLIDLVAGREVAALGASVEWDLPLRWEPSGDLLTYGSSGFLRWPMRADPVRTGRYLLGPSEMILPIRQTILWGSSADGQTIAVPYQNRGAEVVHRGPPTRTVRLQPQQEVRCCAVSPDGRWVATGSHGDVIDGYGAKVWDAATGKLAKAFRVSGICWVAFSPDGRWLLTNGGGCRLWEVGSWTEGPKIGGEWCCFSPDSRLLAVEKSPNAIRLVRLESGRELARLEAPDHNRLIPKLFTPDGTRLIAYGFETRTLHVWDLRLIRKGLGRLGLDWGAPPYPEETDRTLEPIEVQMVGAQRSDPNKK